MYNVRVACRGVLIRKLSSAGRASALQAEGHRFEPYSFHHRLCASHGGRFGPVVQLVRTLACHARGRRFEPDPGRHAIFQNGCVRNSVCMVLVNSLPL